MNTKIKLIAALICINIFSTYAQTFNVAIDNHKQYEAIGPVIANAGDTYIAAGRTIAQSLDKDSLLIIKTATNGNLLWVRKHVFAPNYGHWANELYALPTGNYVVGGSVTNDTINHSDNPYLLEIDSAGNQLAFHHYGSEFEEVGNCSTRAADGGFYLAGWSDRYAGGANHNSDGYVVKVNQNYGMEWIQYFQRPKVNTVYAIVATPDSGCVALVQNTVCCFDNDASLIKLNKYGDIDWEHINEMSPNKEHIVLDLISTRDGGYFITGQYDLGFLKTRAYFLKTDSAGTMEWEKKINFGSYRHTPDEAIQLADGSYVIGGTLETAGWTGIPPNTHYNLVGWLCKLSENGDTLWSHTYEHYADSLVGDEYFYGMTLCTDGGFALCGMSINLAPERNNAWVVRTDSLGNACAATAPMWAANCTADTLHLAAQSSLALSAQVQGGCPPYIYIWSGNGAQYLNNTAAQYPIFAPPDTGSYQFDLSVIDSDSLQVGLTIFVQVVNDTATVLPVVAPNDVVAIFPNPANDVFYLKTHYKQPIQVLIYDIYGRLIRSLTLPKGQQTSEIDTHNWQAGMYVYHLSDDDTVLQSGKLTVLHH